MKLLKRADKPDMPSKPINQRETPFGHFFDIIPMVHSHILWRRRTGLAHFLADATVLGTCDSRVQVIVCVLSGGPKVIKIVA